MASSSCHAISVRNVDSSHHSIIMESAARTIPSISGISIWDFQQKKHSERRTSSTIIQSEKCSRTWTAHFTQKHARSVTTPTPAATSTQRSGAGATHANSQCVITHGAVQIDHQKNRKQHVRKETTKMMRTNGGKTGPWKTDLPQGNDAQNARHHHRPRVRQIFAQRARMRSHRPETRSRGI